MHSGSSRDGHTFWCGGLLTALCLTGPVVHAQTAGSALNDVVTHQYAKVKAGHDKIRAQNPAGLQVRPARAPGLPVPCRIAN